MADITLSGNSFEQKDANSLNLLNVSDSTNASSKKDESYLSELAGLVTSDEKWKSRLAFEMKTIPLFLPGMYGMAGMAVTNALDHAHRNDDLKTQMIDLGLGAAQGAAVKEVFNLSSNLPGGLLTKGLAVGLASNVLDSGLERRNYITDRGEFSLSQGLGRTLSNTFNGENLTMTIGTLALGGATLAAGDYLSSGLLSKSPFISTVLAGGTMGFYGGAMKEASLERNAGAPISFSNMLRAGLEQSILTGIAAIPGGVVAEHSAVEAQARNATDDSYTDPVHGKSVRTTYDITGRPRYEFNDGTEMVMRADDQYSIYTKDGLRIDHRNMPAFTEGNKPGVAQYNEQLLQSGGFSKQADGSYVKESPGSSIYGSEAKTIQTIGADGSYSTVTTGLANGSSQKLVIAADGARYAETITPGTTGMDASGNKTLTFGGSNGETITYKPDGSAVRRTGWGLTEIMKPDGTYIAGTGNGFDASVNAPDGTHYLQEMGGVHNQVSTPFGSRYYFHDIAKAPDSLDNDFTGRMVDRLNVDYKAYAGQQGTVAGIRNFFFDNILHQPKTYLQSGLSALKAEAAR